MSSMFILKIKKNYIMEENKIKVYEVIKDDSDVFAISLVDYPAIESNFIYLSKDNKPKQIFLETEEKHMLYGAVLIPDFPIYRYDGVNEYYIQFSKETIEKLSYDYMLNGRLKSFTEQHEKDIYGEVTIVESWLKLSENDKSVDLGLDVPVGTWIIGAKVHDVDVWDKIKKGEVKGFSVESFVSLDLIEKLCKQKENTMFNEESFLEKIQLAIETALSKFNKTEELSVEELKEDEVKEEVVEELKEDDVVEEKVEETEEKVENEEVVEEPATEEPKEDEVEVIDEVKVEMEKTIQSLKEELENIKAELASVKEENIKLSKQPSVEPITSTEKSNKDSRFDAMLSIMNGNAFRK